MTPGHRGSLRWWTITAIALAVLTVLVVPLPAGSKLWLLAVLAFAAIFTVLEATSRTRVLAVAMIALLGLYLAVSFQRAVILLSTPGWITKGFGVAMLLIPAVGTWALVREVVFGSRAQRLGRVLAAEGEHPRDDIARTASGRYVREAADAHFARVRERVTAQPAEWREWYRLSLAYSASSDTRRARWAMRTAIALYRGADPGAVAAR